jgi:peptide/nickel transport system permease protein
MIRVVANRLAMVLPVLFLMTIVTYLLVSLIPGNAAIVILGQDATPERIAALSRELRLDQPFYVQWWYWLQGAFQGDLGTSLYTGEPVTKVLKQRLLPTLYVSVLATLVGAVIGYFLGAWAAIRRGTISKVLDTFAMVGVSLPNFWFALLLIVFVARRFDFLPPLGYVPLSDGVLPWAQHMVLPVAALGLAGIAIIAKQTRDSLSEALSRDFMRFLQANGFSRRSLLYKHAPRYAAMPIASSVLGSFANLFGGTVALEAIFAIPGLGSMVLTATTQRDLVVIQGAVLAYTLVVLLATVLNDVVNVLLNPKLRTR